MFDRSDRARVNYEKCTREQDMDFHDLPPGGADGTFLRLNLSLGNLGWTECDVCNSLSVSCVMAAAIVGGGPDYDTRYE